MDRDKGLSTSAWVVIVVITITIFLCIIARALTVSTPDNIQPKDVIGVDISTDKFNQDTSPEPTEDVSAPTDSPNPPSIPPSAKPTEIVVKGWHVYRPNCVNITRKWVNITSVDIMGGIPPYEFKFIQKGEVIRDEIISGDETSFSTEIIFSEPITIVTGSFVNVTISSDSIDGEPIWNNRLYFPFFDPLCIISDEE